MRQRRLLLWWCGTRAVTLVMLFGYEGRHGVAGDINYFSHSLEAAARVGLAHTLVEYPLPAVGVVAVPWVLAHLLGNVHLYGGLLVASALAVDGAFTALLARQRGPGRDPAVFLWLLAGPVLGGLTLARFDLLVGVLVACSLLAVRARPRLASVLLALATGLKLWPLVLMPSLLAATRRRVEGALAYALTGAVLALGSLWIAGWDRLVSPLGYQADRGLQVESMAAAPVMVGWLLSPGTWHVGLSRYKSFEIDGPWVPALSGVSSVLMLVLAAALVTVWVRALRRAEPLSAEALLWVWLASVSGLLLAAKVFSPQYLLWVVPVTAVGLVVAPSPALRRWSAWLLVAGGMSHLLYPALYWGLVIHNWQAPVAVPLLVLRNVLVVVLAVWAARQAWRHTATDPRAVRASEGSSTLTH